MGKCGDGGTLGCGGRFCLTGTGFWHIINEREYRLNCIMNRKQEIILWVGLIVIQLMRVFPPVGRLQGGAENVGGPPEGSIVTGWTRNYGVITRDYKNIRFGMLAVQLIIVAAVTGGFIYTWRITGQQEDGH